MMTNQKPAVIDQDWKDADDAFRRWHRYSPIGDTSNSWMAGYRAALAERRAAEPAAHPNSVNTIGVIAPPTDPSHEPGTKCTEHRWISLVVDGVTHCEVCGERAEVIFLNRPAVRTRRCQSSGPSNKQA